MIPAVLNQLRDYKMIAILDAYKTGVLKPKFWLQNILAGSIVGVVALPLAMAFAIASGVKPEQGIYTAIIAAFFVAVFGGSRVQISGPTGAFVVILAAITAKYGVTGLQIATMMAGVLLLLMGYFKLGNVVKFIPDPVIVGFTSGIGVIIFVGQLKDFFGLSVTFPIDEKFHFKLSSLFQALPHANITTTTMAFASLFLILLTPKLLKRIPGPLVALLVMTGLQEVFQFEGVATLGSAFGGIPQQLPHLAIPDFGINEVMTLIGPAFTIALLGGIESLLSASAADGMAGTTHNSNQELIGQGLANIVAPIFGGFASTGAIARTATNVRNGGNSPISAIVHSLFLLLIILLLAPYAVNVPLCTLAAILFVVAYNMSDMPHFIRIVKCAPATDTLVLFATFLLTIFTDLVLAVNIGVVLAMVFFVRRMNQFVSVEDHSRHADTQKELLSCGIEMPIEDTMIFNIQGPVFFGAAVKIEHALTITHSDPVNVIFRLKDVPFIDMTGLETLHEVMDAYRKRGIHVYLCEANQHVIDRLNDVDLLSHAMGGRVYVSLNEIINEIQSAKLPDSVSPVLLKVNAQ